ncbi:hypothetical protein OQA88_3737 [Cercophora sp. LCS_1]
MARADSPADDSPLSSMESSEDEFPDEATEIMEDERPTKRQRVGPGSAASSAVIQEANAEGAPIDDLDNLSSDTEGDVPSSPINARADEDDIQEQITVCAWEGCTAGDMGNMDMLVEHIHNEHIENRAKKYTCEWVGCLRKSMAHASGYALKAHMRSHTREKPFYCYLPECDRAFTRSDALAKHMRTVHETEALRPSDPVPKSLQSGGPSGKSSKLKIIIKTPQSHATGQDDTVNDDSAGADSDAEMFTPLTEDQGFEPSDLAMPLPRLFALSRKRLQWAEAEAEELRQEIKVWEDKYKQDWLDKEVLLDQVVQSELEYTNRRKAVISGAADVVVTTSEA